MKNILYIFFCALGCTCLYSQVGVNTNGPIQTLDVNGTLRIRDVPQSISTDDYELVIDPITHKVDRKVSDELGVFRAYLGTDLSSLNNGDITKIIGFNIISNVNNEFNLNTNEFTAPIKGRYRVTITYTAYIESGTDGVPDEVIIGLVDNVTNMWYLNFNTPKVSYYQVSNTAGTTNSHIGVVELEENQNIYFGISKNATLLAEPYGTTGSGIGSLFEIQLVSLN